jgi:hypothetical protein
MRSIRIIVGVLAIIVAMAGVFAAYADDKQKPDSGGLQSEALGF